MDNVQMDNNFLEVVDRFTEALIAKIDAQQEPVRLLTLHDVAELLSISHQHLTKNVMHNPGFPKPVRLNERGSLRFYKHEIEEYILGLKERV